jgi:hypothetical protein
MEVVHRKKRFIDAKVNIFPRKTIPKTSLSYEKDIYSSKRIAGTPEKILNFATDNQNAEENEKTVKSFSGDGNAGGHAGTDP